MNDTDEQKCGIDTKDAGETIDTTPTNSSGKGVMETEVFKLPTIVAPLKGGKATKSKITDVKQEIRGKPSSEVAPREHPVDESIQIREPDVNNKADAHDDGMAGGNYESKEGQKVEEVTKDDKTHDKITQGDHTLKTKDNEKSKERRQPQKATFSQQNPSKPMDVPYSEPSWGARCDDPYYFEVIKNGCVVKNLDLHGKSFFVAGRLDNCDIKLEHPSSSRHHAILQYKGASDSTKGFYIFDLGSTHGTFVNKVQIKEKKYFRLRVGFVVKFGGSSRMYILQGPEEYEEQEPEVTEQSTPQTGDKQLGGMAVIEDTDDIKEEAKDEGIDWGMGEDAVEEEMDLEKLLESRKPLELKDPKKTLRGYFEREGLELEYEDEEKGKGNAKSFIIRVRLPIETPSGEDVYAEATSSKKKDAVLACAVRACHILDAHDMLRNAEHESVRAKRRKMMEENDYYDSDEDNFLDRTGSVEKKRKLRMQKAGKHEESDIESYDSLTKKAEEIQLQINTIIDRIDELNSGIKSDDDDDSLDAYMNQMNTKLRKDAVRRIEKELEKLEREKSEINRLIEICKPALLPPSPSLNPSTSIHGGKRQGKVSEVVKTSPSMVTNEEVATEVSKNIDAVEHQKSIARDADARHKSKLNSSDESQMIPKGDNKGDSEPSGNKPFAVPSVKDKKKKKKKIYSAPTMQQAVQDTRFTNWTPPEGQTGDGYTKLNEKYGY